MDLQQDRMWWEEIATLKAEVKEELLVGDNKTASPNEGNTH